MKKVYDVIVVGAGPAGSSTAYECVLRGMKVLLLDQRKKPGTPKQCAEGINQEMVKELGLQLKPEEISREIKGISFSDFEHKILLEGRRTRGYVLDRKVFDFNLAQKAIKAGAEAKFGVKVVKLESDTIITSSGSKFVAKVIVGADGPLSIVGKESGLGNPKCGLGLQYEIICSDFAQSEYMHFYLCPKFIPDGYLWVFPKKITLNVGLGVQNIKPVNQVLEQFVMRLGLDKYKLKEKNSGLIPLHGPISKFCSDNIILVGDAAGHTNPISGGGIPVAIFDGKLAAEVIDEHLKRGTSLEEYQQRWWNSNFGRAMKLSLKITGHYPNNFAAVIAEMLPRTGVIIKSKRELFKMAWQVRNLHNKGYLLLHLPQLLKYSKYMW